MAYFSSLVVRKLLSTINVRDFPGERLSGAAKR